MDKCDHTIFVLLSKTFWFSPSEDEDNVDIEAEWMAGMRSDKVEVDFSLFFGSTTLLLQ